RTVAYASGSVLQIAKCFRQVVEEVARDERDFADVVAGHVAGQTVDVDAELGGRERLQLLADESRDQPREDVAGPTGGQPGIAGVVLIKLSAIGDDGAVALQSQD